MNQKALLGEGIQIIKNDITNNNEYFCSGVTEWLKYYSSEIKNHPDLRNKIKKTWNEVQKTLKSVFESLEGVHKKDETEQKIEKHKAIQSNVNGQTIEQILSNFSSLKGTDYGLIDKKFL